MRKHHQTKPAKLKCFNAQNGEKATDHPVQTELNSEFTAAEAELGFLAEFHLLPFYLLLYSHIWTLHVWTLVVSKS